MNEHLRHLRHSAQRAATQPGYIARTLSAYMRLEKLKQDQLVHFLGCTEENLYLLALCRLPNIRSSDFPKKVRAVADYAGVEVQSLMSIIKRIAAIEALQGQLMDQTNEPVLLAARQREDNESGTPDKRKDENAR